MTHCTLLNTYPIYCIYISSSNLYQIGVNQNTHSINYTPLNAAVTAVTTAAAVTPELLSFFLHNHLFSFIYPSVSFCMVHFFLLKPLKSNFLQFLEEASIGQCVGVIPEGPYTLHTDQLMPPL